MGRTLGWSLACWVWTALGTPGTDNIETVMAFLRQVERVEATYTETIESALLAIAVTAHGRIEYRAPERILKTGEAGDSVEIAGDRILVRQGGEVREIAVADHPGVEGLVVALRAVFAGDLGRLRRDYRLEFSAAGAEWDLTLRPLERHLLGLFERVRIAGQGATISRIEIEEPNGDRRSMELRLVSRQPAGLP